MDEPGSPQLIEMADIHPPAVEAHTRDNVEPEREHVEVAKTTHRKEDHGDMEPEIGLEGDGRTELPQFDPNSVSGTSVKKKEDVKSGQEDCQESSPAFHQENSEQFEKLQPVDSKKIEQDKEHKKTPDQEQESSALVPQSGLSEPEIPSAPADALSGLSEPETPSAPTDALSGPSETPSTPADALSGPGEHITPSAPADALSGPSEPETPSTPADALSGPGEHITPSAPADALSGTISEMNVLPPPAIIDLRQDVVDNPTHVAIVVEPAMEVNADETIDVEPEMQGGRKNFISGSKSGFKGQNVTTTPVQSSIIIRSKRKGNDLSGVRMKKAMSDERNYFEVTIKKTVGEGVIGIGVGHENYNLSAMPGWEGGSIGYHADDGGLFHEQGFARLLGLCCGEGDRMGCGVDFTLAEDGNVRVWFTRNDQLVFHPQIFKLPANPRSSIYPLICMEASGQEVQFMGQWQKPLPTDDPIPWWCAAGFESEEDVPFHSKKSSYLKYGKWKWVPHHMGAMSMMAPLSYGLNCVDSISEQCKNAKSASDCLEIAESIIRDNHFWLAGFDDLRAPNGATLDKRDRVALYLAQKILSQVDKDEAIPQCLMSFNNVILQVSVVGGLLYMGCSPDVCIQLPSVFRKLLLNWEANPDLQYNDCNGQTALHVHQTDLELLKMLIKANANVNAQDNVGDTPLHIAMANGRIAVADILLNKGALTNIFNAKKQTALDTAAALGDFHSFKCVFDHATKTVRTSHFYSEEEDDAFMKWKKAYNGLESKWRQVRHENIQELTPEQIYCVAVNEQGNGRFPCISVQRMLSDAAQLGIDVTPQFLTKIFDSCLFGNNLLITDVLEADVNGNLPDAKAKEQAGADCQSTDGKTTVRKSAEDAIEAAVNGDAPTDVLEDDLFVNLPDGGAAEKDSAQGISLLSYLSDRPELFYKLSSHPTMKTFVQLQWNQKASKWFWFWLFCYLFKMAILTSALAIAARPELTDQQLNKYPEPLDYFRGICEGILLIIILFNIVDEIRECIMSGLSGYLSDQLNYFQWISICLTLLIIPFRAADHHGQWIVASLAYFSHGMRAFQHASLLRLTGPYIHALLIIAARDILRFMVVFTIMLAVFSGAFYLSLRYDDTSVTSISSNTTSPGGGVNSDQRDLDGEGRLLHEVYFTGLRVLIEAGSALNYYGSNGSLRILSVVLYLMFLFMVVIVLLNTLIAQVSDTYTKVLKTAEDVHLFYQCAYIAKLEKQKIHFVNSSLKMLLAKCLACLKWLGCNCPCFVSPTLHERKFPNSVWIGKSNHGGSKYTRVLEAVRNFFSLHGFGEDDDSTLTKVVEEETDKVERKIEEQVKKLAEQLEEVHVTSRQKIEKEVKKLAEQLEEVHVTSRRKIGEEVKTLAKQLGVDVGHDSTVTKVVKEETDKVEKKVEAEVKKLAVQLNEVCAVQVTSRQKVEEEVKKLAEQLTYKEEQVRKLQEQLVCKEEEVKKQLEEVMSLLRKGPDHVQEPSDQVPSEEGEEPSYP